MEDKKVKPQLGPGQVGDHGSIEWLLKGIHPGPLRDGKCEPVCVTISEMEVGTWKNVKTIRIPEENILKGGASSLVSFGKSNLSLRRAGVTTCFYIFFD